MSYYWWFMYRCPRCGRHSKLSSSAPRPVIQLPCFHCLRDGEEVQLNVIRVTKHDEEKEIERMLKRDEREMKTQQ